MYRARRKQYVQILVAAVVVALALALSWHLVAMGVHGMAMILGLCLAVLAAAGVSLFAGRPILPVGPAAILTPPERPETERIEPLGRHPPDEGIRLRH